MKKMVSICVVSIGVIIAVCAAAKLPAEGERFPDTAHVALVALGVAALGIVLWRIADRPQGTRRVIDQTDQKDPLNLISRIREPLGELCDTASQLDQRELRRQIDQISDQYVLPLSTSKNAIVERLGVRQGAELLIELALFERLLNRAWSAAADGHVTEAISSLREAHAAYTVIQLPTEC